MSISTNKISGAAAFALMLTVSNPALALDKIYSPNVHKGELEVEYIGSRTFDSDNTKDHEQGHEFELEYGLTDRLMLEMATELEREPGEETKWEANEIGGRWQFFEQGQYWLDAGLLVAYKNATHRDDANAIEGKLLLEKQTGRLLHRANLGLEQEVGPHSSGGPERDILWNSRYLLDPHFNPGIELQSGFGKANEHLGYDEQEHYVGPAVYGMIIPNVKYEAAYLFGASKAAAQGAARVLLEYEVYF